MIYIILPIIVALAIKVAYNKGVEDGELSGALNAKDSIQEQLASGELFVKDGILTPKDGLLRIRFK